MRFFTNTYSFGGAGSSSMSRPGRSFSSSSLPGRSGCQGFWVNLIECLKLHSSSFSYSLKTCYWLSFPRRLLVPSCCLRCVMAGVEPDAMPADVCSLLAEAQRNVLPQSHRARSMSSCCLKTLRARSIFPRFFFFCVGVFVFLFFFEKS